MSARRPLIAVHGFMYDPGNKDGPNDPKGFFAQMSGIAGRAVQGFAWYSVPFGFRPARPLFSAFQTTRAWAGSWLHGHLHPYRYAWDLAVREAERLAWFVRETGEPVDIVAHSLGSRVTLQALAELPEGLVRRVVFFNGAELAENARRLAPGPQTQVLNVAVSCDKALRWLGSRCSGDPNGPCIGSVGLGESRPANWVDVFLDDPALHKRAMARRGWTLRGDAPNSLLDHGESYTFAGNADLVRAFLGGDDLKDLVA